MFFLHVFIFSWLALDFGFWLLASGFGFGFRHLHVFQPGFVASVAFVDIFLGGFTILYLSIHISIYLSELNILI